MCIKDRVRFILKVYSCNIGVCKAINLWNGYKKAKALLCIQQGFHKKGGDLLSHFRSTIGAEGLNFSVRNGKRWNPLAITT